ncbi:MAG: hypothetical protein HQL53_00355 [Magnetococcales bacterium]|nr:hypothetical protein [Magnetococcales bacterium]
MLTNVFIAAAYLIVGVITMNLLTQRATFPAYSVADWMVDWVSVEATRRHVHPLVVVVTALGLSGTALIFWPLVSVVMSIPKQEYSQL